MKIYVLLFMLVLPPFHYSFDFDDPESMITHPDSDIEEDIVPDVYSDDEQEEIEEVIIIEEE